MSDKGYRALENELINKVDKKRKRTIAENATVERKSVEKQPKTQVEFY